MKRSLALIVVMAALAGVMLIQRNRSKENPEQSKAIVLDEKAVEVLRKAEVACKALTSGSYRAEYRGEGVLAKSPPPVRGTVQFDSAKDWLRVSGTVSPPGLSDLSFDVTTDGEQVVGVDHASKRSNAGAYPFARFLMAPGLALSMPKFGNEAPFRTELGRGAKYEGVRDEGGTACDVVTLTEGGNADRWYFAQADHLPRRVEHVINLWANKDGTDKSILTMTDIKAATFAQADFQVVTPEGYAENKIEAPSPLLAVGTPAPDWELKTPKGQSVRLSEMRGNVVVLDFWATWCGPCKMAMPKIQELHAEYESQRVKVFGVNCQEDPRGDPDAYMQSKNYTYGLLVAGDPVARAYHVAALPTFYVIDAQGVIIHSEIGSGNEAALKEAVKKAIEGESTKTAAKSDS